jgi:hypothetical protein
MEEDLFAFLKTTVGHTRVHALVVPETQDTYPAVAYQCIGAPDQLDSGGVADLIEGRFQIDCYGKTYLEAKTESRKVRDALSGYSGTMGSTRVGSAVRDSHFEDFAADLYRVSTDYIIYYEE